MAINKVEICGVDTGKLPRISYKKSTELLERIKSGDESARDEFIQANLRLERYSKVLKPRRTAG